MYGNLILGAKNYGNLSIWDKSLDNLDKLQYVSVKTTPLIWG
jgi:hypothetical protein